MTKEESMNMTMKTLGRTGLTVSALCIGTSPLGGMPQAYGYDADADSAREAVREVFDSVVNFMDTSNEYSDGESEQRIGDVVRERGLPGGFVLATKIDPARGASAFPGTRVRESFTESIHRLGVEHIPLLYLHDPSRFELADITAPGGPVDMMIELKNEGVVGSLGVADGDTDYLGRLLDTGSFDVVLNHNRYTLVDRSAGSLMDRAVADGIAFVNAAPFGSGILAKGADAHPRYAYAPVDDRLREMVTEMQAACANAGVDLATAALQFSMRDPRVASTVVGLSKPGRVASLVRHAQSDVPPELWTEIETIFQRGRS
jgi:D-threo-aldose 1-dehydrogenase